MELTTRNTNIITFAFANKHLNSQTKKIAAIGQRTKESQYQLAAILADIAATECYIEDGFESVQDYAEQIFGFRKSATYAYMKLGENYVNDTGKGSIFATENGDFTAYALTRCMALPHEVMVQAIQDGILTPDMSSRDIDKKVKEIKLTLKATESKETDESESKETDESESAAPTDVEYEMECAEQDLRAAVNRLYAIHGNVEAVMDIFTAIVNELNG